MENNYLHVWNVWVHVMEVSVACVIECICDDCLSQW